MSSGADGPAITERQETDDSAASSFCFASFRGSEFLRTTAKVLFGRSHAGYLLPFSYVVRPNAANKELRREDFLLAPTVVRQGRRAGLRGRTDGRIKILTVHGGRCALLPDAGPLLFRHCF